MFDKLFRNRNAKPKDDNNLSAFSSLKQAISNQKTLGQIRANRVVFNKEAVSMKISVPKHNSLYNNQNFKDDFKTFFNQESTQRDSSLDNHTFNTIEKKPDHNRTFSYMTEDNTRHQLTMINSTN